MGMKEFEIRKKKFQNLKKKKSNVVTSCKLGMFSWYCPVHLKVESIMHT